MKAASWLFPYLGSLILAIIVQVGERLLDTTYFTDFLKDELISLIITVLAINAATLSITLGKVRELIDQHGGDFSSTRKACLNSLIEQFVLILVAILFLVLYSSPVITTPWPGTQLLFAIVFTTCFFQELWVLFDTTKSIFIVLDFGKK